MATWYFDSVNGLDANNGTSSATPKQNYHLFSHAGATFGDTFLFKRGTTQIVNTAFTAALRGNSETVRSRYAVYGESDYNYCTWTNPTAVGGMVLNVAARRFIDFEDMRFDAGGVNNNAVFAQVQGASNVNGLRFYRCHFYNSVSSGLNIGLQGGSTITGLVFGIVLEDCEAYDNGGHGVILVGCEGAHVRRSKFYRNGALLSTGGHGFSSGYGKKEDLTTGWTNTSGTIWQRSLAANELDIFYVQTTVFNYVRVRRTSGTATAPGIGEYGVSGGVLYINVNRATNPSSQGVRYGWRKCRNLVIEDCEAYDNVWNQAAPYHEGHGFAFDDFADDSCFLRNKSYNNQGAGFSINLGDRNRVVGNIAYGNWQSAVVNTPTDGTVITNNTFFNNNAGTGAHDAEIKFSNYCKDAVVSNNIVISTKAYSVANEATNTGFTGTRNNLIGGTTALEKTPFLISTVTDDPLLDENNRPRTLTLKRAGTYLGGKDFHGKQFYDPPNIGAVDEATETLRYLFYR
ncbi:MAG: right-handed parallel beta-helix repeat-containing protein [Nitrosospira sp.]|nr:right-handed parallel beta-helix repeat-containing protein [Nitrosospira sp.]